MGTYDNDNYLYLLRSEEYSNGLIYPGDMVIMTDMVAQRSVSITTTYTVSRVKKSPGKRPGLISVKVDLSHHSETRTEPYSKCIVSKEDKTVQGTLLRSSDCMLYIDDIVMVKDGSLKGSLGKIIEISLSSKGIPMFTISDMDMEKRYLEFREYVRNNPDLGFLYKTVNFDSIRLRDEIQESMYFEFLMNNKGLIKDIENTCKSEVSAEDVEFVERFPPNVYLERKSSQPNI